MVGAGERHKVPGVGAAQIAVHVLALHKAGIGDFNPAAQARRGSRLRKFTTIAGLGVIAAPPGLISASDRVRKIADPSVGKETLASSGASSSSAILVALPTMPLAPRPGVRETRRVQALGEFGGDPLRPV
jgi:hypothetical protein